MSHPLFSVIVPTRNRPVELQRCISAVAHCDFDRSRLEIIVVNDGGVPVECEALRKACGSATLRVLNKSNGGPGSARNFAAVAASGDFLAFIDDDCAPAKDWLRSLEHAVSRRPNALHGGRTINLLTDNRYSEASQTLLDYVYGYYNDPLQCRNRFFASNNMTVPARLFAEVGGFDEAFRTAEDRDFCRRWRAAGYDFRYSEEVVVFHGHRLSIGSLQRQHFQYGRGALPYWRKAARMQDVRLKVEPVSFYIGMVRHPFARKQKGSALVAALVVLSQVANAAGFAVEAALELMTTLSAPGQQITRSDADAARCSSPSVSYHGGVANEIS
jgi:Predicted glycosyltransferases